jgi:hypothetical protein
VCADRDGSAVLHKVKAVAENVFAKRKSWPLKLLQRVESTVENGVDTAAFVLELEKPYAWVAKSRAEKQTFLASLQKVELRPHPSTTRLPSLMTHGSWQRPAPPMPSSLSTWATTAAVRHRKPAVVVRS